MKHRKGILTSPLKLHQAGIVDEVSIMQGFEP